MKGECVYDFATNYDMVAICPAPGWRAVEVFEPDGYLDVSPIAGWLIFDSPKVVGREVLPLVADGNNLMLLNDGSHLLLGPGQRIPWRIRKEAWRMRWGYWMRRIKKWLSSGKRHAIANMIGKGKPDGTRSNK